MLQTYEDHSQSKAVSEATKRTEGLNVLQLKSNFQIIGLTFMCTDSTPC